MRSYLHMWWTDRLTSLDWWIEDVLIDGAVTIALFTVVARLVYGGWWWNA